jgi:hypothetical protein
MTKKLGRLGRFTKINNKYKPKSKPKSKSKSKSKGVSGKNNNSLRKQLLKSRARYAASLENRNSEDTYKLTIPLLGWNSKLRGKMRKYKVSRFTAQNIYNNRERCTHGLTTIVKKSETLKNILADINNLILKSGDEGINEDCLFNRFIIGTSENKKFENLYKGNGTIISVESEYNNKLFNPKYREGDEIVGLRQIIDLELTAN